MKKEKIIKSAKEAIRKGFGNYYVMKSLTWNDLLKGYEAGKRLVDYQEVEVLSKIALLG